MKYSKIALNILAAKECGLFKYNTDFWSKYPSEKEFISDINNNQMVSNKLIELEFFIVIVAFPIAIPFTVKL